LLCGGGPSARRREAPVPRIWPRVLTDDRQHEHYQQGAAWPGRLGSSCCAGPAGPYRRGILPAANNRRAATGGPRVKTKGTCALRFVRIPWTCKAGWAAGLSKDKSKFAGSRPKTRGTVTFGQSELYTLHVHLRCYRFESSTTVRVVPQVYCLGHP
jgi:hypothetical protein